MAKNDPFIPLPVRTALLLWLSLTVFAMSGCEQQAPEQQSTEPQPSPSQVQEPPGQTAPEAPEKPSDALQLSDVPPELALEQLKLRVNTYWAAVEESDVLSAYGMESTAKPRGDLDPAAYFRTSPAGKRGRNTEVLDVFLTEDGEGRAKVRYHVVLKMAFRPEIIEVTREEPWVWVDGDWYHEPDKQHKAGTVPFAKPRLEPPDPRLKITERLLPEGEAGGTLTGKLGEEDTQEKP